jgi:hypothetical protein
MHHIGILQHDEKPRKTENKAIIPGQEQQFLPPAYAVGQNPVETLIGCKMKYLFN